MSDTDLRLWNLSFAARYLEDPLHRARAQRELAEILAQLYPLPPETPQGAIVLGSPPGARDA